MSNPASRHLNHIRRFRLEKQLTQRELASILGYKSASTLSHLESGRKLPSLVTALKLKAALQRLISDIYPRLYDRVRSPIARRREQLFRQRA